MQLALLSPLKSQHIIVGIQFWTSFKMFPNNEHDNNRVYLFQNNHYWGLLILKI